MKIIFVSRLLRWTERKESRLFFTLDLWTIFHSSSLACFFWLPICERPHPGRSSWTPSRRRSRRWNVDNSCRSKAPTEIATVGWDRCRWNRDRLFRWHLNIRKASKPEWEVCRNPDLRGVLGWVDLIRVQTKQNKLFFKRCWWKYNWKLL